MYAVNDFCLLPVNGYNLDYTSYILKLISRACSLRYTIATYCKHVIVNWCYLRYVQNKRLMNFYYYKYIKYAGKNLLFKFKLV